MGWWAASVLYQKFVVMLLAVDFENSVAESSNVAG